MSHNIRVPQNYQRDAELSGPNLPDLPARVPVPNAGREFKTKTPMVQGTAGQECSLIVNHFRIQSLPIIKTFVYDLRFRIPDSSRPGNNKVSPSLIEKILMHDVVKSFLGDLIFDGVSIAFSHQDRVPTGESVSTTIELQGHTSERHNQVEISIRNRGTLDIKFLVNYIQNGSIELDYTCNPKMELLMNWLNTLFRKDPASRFTTWRGSSAYFDRTPSTTMTLEKSTGGVLEALRGIFQTCQIRFGVLGICVDTATSAFYTPGKNLVDIAQALSGIPPNEDLQVWYQANKTQFYQSCKRLEGLFINLKHLSLSKNAKKIKIIRLSTGDAQQTEFEENLTSTGEARKTTVYR